MRKEAIKMMDQIEAGKPLDSIKGNRKTRAKMHKLYMYRQIVYMMLTEMQKGRYNMDYFKTRSYYELLKKGAKE